MSSLRLPGKVLKSMRGYPLLGHILHRVSNCKNISQIVVATSTSASDQGIYDFVTSLGLPVFRGSLDNVAHRMFSCASELNAQAFVRICGDSPLVCPKLVDRLVGSFADSGNLDMVTNVFPRTYPKGLSVEVVSTEVLGAAIELGLTKQQQEHVTTFFYENSIHYKIFNVRRSPSLENLNFAIDTNTDFTRAENVLDILGEPYFKHDLDAMVLAYSKLSLSSLK